MSTSNVESKNIGEDIDTLAHDARALLAATADIAGEKVAEARTRLAAALESGKAMAANVRERVVEGAKATDKVVRSHPYQAMGVALGAGLLLGYLLGRRWGCSCKS